MTIHQKFTGDPSQLLKAYQELSAANTRLEQQVGNLTRKMSEGAKEGKTGFDGLGLSTRNVTTQLGAMVGSWFSIQTAIAAVNAEIEHHQQLAREALNTHHQLAASQADLFLNAWGRPESETSANRQRITQMASDAKVPEKFMTAAFASAQSTGVGTDEQRLSAVQLSSKLSGQRPENIGNLSKSILMAQQLTGVSPEEAASLFLSGGASAFMENPEQQSRMLRQTLASVAASSTGTDKKRIAEQAVEIGAALTTMVGEERGESARTAAGKLSGDLNTFFTKGFEFTGPRGHKFRKKPKMDPGGVIDRIRVLQNDPKLANAFLEKASFETMFQAPISRALLDKNSEEAKRISDAERTVSYDTKPLAPLLRQLQTGTPSIELERAERGSMVNKEQSELAADQAARRTQANKIWRESLWQTAEHTDAIPGMKLLSNQLSGTFAGAKQLVKPDAVFEDAIKALEYQQKNILGNRNPTLLSAVTNTPGKALDVDKLTQKERADYEYLGKQIAELNQLMKLQLEAQKTAPQLQPTLAPTAARAERGGHREQ